MIRDLLAVKIIALKIWASHQGVIIWKSGWHCWHVHIAHLLLMVGWNSVKLISPIMRHIHWMLIHWFCFANSENAFQNPFWSGAFWNALMIKHPKDVWNPRRLSWEVVSTSEVVQEWGERHHQCYDYDSHWEPHMHTYIDTYSQI